VEDQEDQVFGSPGGKDKDGTPSGPPERVDFVLPVLLVFCSVEVWEGGSKRICRKCRRVLAR
jgi:hypothetical protein